MNQRTDSQIKESRKDLDECAMELAIACPFDESNPPDCPLHQLRKKVLTDRLTWLSALNDEDLKQIIDYHRVCLKIKLLNEPCLSKWARGITKVES